VPFFLPFLPFFNSRKINPGGHQAIISIVLLKMWHMYVTEANRMLFKNMRISPCFTLRKEQTVFFDDLLQNWCQKAVFLCTPGDVLTAAMSLSPVPHLWGLAD
jgi:hypothetical protein